jgi:ABC-type spermidine/putrescine transport system permease subunit II
MSRGATVNRRAHPTLRDVAALAGLSVTTVSHVLNDVPDKRIAIATRERVRAAARIDGASQFQVFYRIYAPMALAPMATLAVLTFSGYWNEFFRPLIFLTSGDKFTLPLGLVSLQ